MCCFSSHLSLSLSSGEPLKDPWETDTLIVASLQGLGLWEAAAEKLVSMLEVNPDSWVTITAYIHGQLQRSLKLRGKTVEESSKDDQSQKGGTKEGDSPSQDGEAPANKDWLKPLIEARDLLQRLAAAELKNFDNKELINRGPLLGRLELVRAVHQSKEKIDMPLGE